MFKIITDSQTTSKRIRKGYPKGKHRNPKLYEAYQKHILLFPDNCVSIGCLIYRIKVRGEEKAINTPKTG